MDPSVSSSSNIVWGTSNGNFTKYRKLRYYDSQKGVIVMKSSQEEKSQSHCSEDPVGCVKLSEKKIKVLRVRAEISKDIIKYFRTYWILYPKEILGNNLTEMK